ncbi:MAG: hypothetical protein QM760_16190 [Nibricoccus sp.]
MSNVSPSQILAKVAHSVPHECLPNIIIIGSLAAGYHFFGEDKNLYVRTKDIDSVLRPRNTAVKSAEAVAEKLIGAGWAHKEDGNHGKPGNQNTPDDKLPAVRLHPPDTTDWFIELLTEPSPGDQVDRHWLRVKLSTGQFGLPSFSFLGVITYKPVKTPFGLFCARPEMMALANLLEHPTVRPERMSGLIESRAIKRSNKDLGRVLALARLSGEKVEAWPAAWTEALIALFPERWKALATQVGAGLRALLASPEDLEEAAYTCNNGLLASRPVTPEQLRITLERLSPRRDRAAGSPRAKLSPLYVWPESVMS